MSVTLCSLCEVECPTSSISSERRSTLCSSIARSTNISVSEFLSKFFLCQIPANNSQFVCFTCFTATAKVHRLWSQMCPAEVELRDRLAIGSYIAQFVPGMAEIQQRKLSAPPAPQPQVYPAADVLLMPPRAAAPTGAQDPLGRQLILVPKTKRKRKLPPPAAPTPRMRKRQYVMSVATHSQMYPVADTVFVAPKGPAPTRARISQKKKQILEKLSVSSIVVTSSTDDTAPAKPAMPTKPAKRPKPPKPPKPAKPAKPTYGRPKMQFPSSFPALSIKAFQLLEEDRYSDAVEVLMKISAKSRKEILNLMGRLAREEMLKFTKQDTLVAKVSRFTPRSFSWKRVMDEFQSHLPILHLVLSYTLTPSTAITKMQIEKNIIGFVPGLSIVLAMLSKMRSERFRLIPALVGMSLQKGGCSSTLINELSRTGICLTPEAICSLPSQYKGGFTDILSAETIHEFLSRQVVPLTPEDTPDEWMMLEEPPLSATNEEDAVDDPPSEGIAQLPGQTPSSSLATNDSNIILANNQPSTGPQLLDQDLAT